MKEVKRGETVKRDVSPKRDKTAARDQNALREQQAKRRSKKRSADWNAVDQDLYLEEKKRRIPAWILPLTVAVLVIVFLFWLAPRLLGKQSQVAEPGKVPADPHLQQADAVIADRTVRLFARPDIRAEAAAYALLNEPAVLIEQNPINGFYHIRLDDQTEGYVREQDLSLSLDSIKPAEVKRKVMVITAEKRILSHTANGNLLQIAPMGTLLYADYATPQVVRVVLPDGQEGWMSTDDLLVLEPDEAIPQPQKTPGDFFCTNAMSFLGVRSIPGGLSNEGADLSGVIYISARVNGLTVPRTLEMQSKVGTNITFAQNERGFADLNGLKAGDLLFFSDPGDDQKITEAAVYLSDHNILYVPPNQASIRLLDLTGNESLHRRLKIVRRLFD